MASAGATGRGDRTAFYERFLKQYDLFHRLCGVLQRNGDVPPGLESDF